MIFEAKAQGATVEEALAAAKAALNAPETADVKVEILEKVQVLLRGLLAIRADADDFPLTDEILGGVLWFSAACEGEANGECRNECGPYSFHRLVLSCWSTECPWALDENHCRVPRAPAGLHQGIFGAYPSL